MSYTLLFYMKNKGFRTVISQTKPDLIAFEYEEKLDYSPDTILEENQCFRIKKFKECSFYPDFLKEGFATSQYNQWESNQWKSIHEGIEYILNTDGQYFYFQKFVKSQLLEKNWFSLSGEPQLKNEKIIIVNFFANAFYEKANDTLLFKKLDDLQRIFLGSEVLYREATKEEVNNFLDNELFNVKNYNKQNLGVHNRKRIALLQEKLTNFKDADNRKRFCKSLKKYCNKIEIDSNGAIVIKTEEDLKNVLYHLDERFYTTEESKEKRLANSIIKINS